MSVVQFRTPGLIPLEAFDTMGISAKVGDHPIGRFGTGLKYAVAVILRERGELRMYRDGVEYQFYTDKKKFRGNEFEFIRMRRKNGIGKWMSSRKLPFTTLLGRDWSLWQAYRELESNTRDEGGVTTSSESPLASGLDQPGTTIEVDCRGFSQAIEEEEVFLDTDGTERVFRSPKVDIYDAPSKYLYYRGIRVYELRYPSLFTYDFGEGVVTLTEDRTIGNLWSVMWDLAYTIQTKVEDESVLDRILEKSSEASFENYELNFDASRGGSYFRERARYLGSLGLLGVSGGRYYNEYTTEEEREASTSIELPDWAWEHILELLDEDAAEEAETNSRDVAEKIRENF